MNMTHPNSKTYLPCDYASLRRGVAGLLARPDSAQMGAGELVSHFPEVRPQSVYGLLYRMREAGELRRNEAGQYGLAAAVASAVPPAPDAAPTAATAAVTVTVCEAGASGKGTAKRLIWTMDERMALAQAVVALRVMQPKKPLLHLLHEAQLMAGVIAPERRRNIAQLSVVPWLAGLVHNLEQAAIDLAVKTDSAPVLAAVPLAATATAQAPAAAAAAAPVREAEAMTAGLVEQLGSSLGAILARALAHPDVLETVDELFSRFVAPRVGIAPARGAPTSVSNGLRAPVMATETVASRPPRHNPEPPVLTPAAPKKPHILIAGLPKANHMQAMREQFGDVFDLRFYHPNQAMPMLRSMARVADKVIIMTDHVGHKHTDCLKGDSVGYLMCPGSIGKITELLATMRVNM